MSLVEGPNIDRMPKKLNIACGFDIREGYLNIDSGDWHNPDMVVDVTDLGSFPSGYFTEALAQDILEHIPRLKQVSTLKEWARVLADNGILRVRVPSIVDLVNLLNDVNFESLEQQHYWVQMVHGTQAYPGDFHLCAYTCLTLVDIGRQAGLFIVEASIKDGWLFDVVYKKIENESQLAPREWLAHQYMAQARRTPDKEGLNYWESVMAEGAMSRYDIAHTLNASRART